MTDTPGDWLCPLCYSMNDARTMHCACVGQVTEGMRSLEMTATSGGPRHDTRPSASSAYSTGTSRRSKPAGISMPTGSGESKYLSGSASSSASSTASPPRQPPRGIAMPFTTPTPHPIESTNVPTPPNRQQRTHHHAQASNQATLYPSSAYRAPPPVYGEPMLPNTLPRAPRYGELGWAPPEVRPQHPNLSPQPWPETSSTLASQRTGYPQREEDRMLENKRRRDNKTVEQKEQDRLYQQGYRAAMKDEGKDDYLEKDRVRKRNKTKADIRKREADERERDEANATGDIGEKRAKKDGKKK